MELKEYVQRWRFLGSHSTGSMGDSVLMVGTSMVFVVSTVMSGKLFATSSVFSLGFLAFPVIFKREEPVKERVFSEFLSILFPSISISVISKDLSRVSREIRNSRGASDERKKEYSTSSHFL